MKYLNGFTEFINEMAFYQKGLNPSFWQDEAFDPEVRSKLIRIAMDFYEDLKADAPIEDIQLTGSLANYNWTEHSDLDVHVILDMAKINEDVELVKKAMDGVRFMWNLRHPVQIRGYDVELYAQDVNQIHKASGLYSLLKNEWIRKPAYNPPSVDPNDVHRKVQAYGVEIEEIKRQLESADPELAADLLERASALKKKISRARDEKLAHEGGEFSVENLVFKEMRNNGMFEELINIKSDAYSKIYSEPPSSEQDGVLEALSPESIERLRAMLDQIKPAIAATSRLVQLGLAADSSEVAMRDLLKSYVKAARGEGLDPRNKEDLSILIDLGKEAGMQALLALESDGAKALAEKGLLLVSSPIQIANGNLIWSVDPNYRSHDGWGIGFFPGPRIIRRMTPKKIKIGVWGRFTGSMDIRIKKFSDTGSDLDFFNTAMKWAAENIDFDQVKRNPEQTVWKYYTKRRSGNTERTESETLKIQAAELGKNLWLEPGNRDEFWRTVAAQHDLLARASRLDGNASGEKFHQAEAAMARDKIGKKST